MVFEVVNRSNLTILKVTNFTDMLTVSDIHFMDTQGYKFRLNGQPVSAENAYTDVIKAYARELQANANGR